MLADQSTRQQSRVTTLTIQQGLFEFSVMPYGVMNAPAVFQQLMQRVLSGVQLGLHQICQHNLKHNKWAYYASIIR